MGTTGEARGVVSWVAELVNLYLASLHQSEHLQGLCSVFSPIFLLVKINFFPLLSNEGEIRQLLSN